MVTCHALWLLLPSVVTPQLVTPILVSGLDQRLDFLNRQAFVCALELQDFIYCEPLGRIVREVADVFVDKGNAVYIWWRVSLCFPVGDILYGGQLQGE